MIVTVDRRFLLIFCLSLALHGSLFALTSWQRKPETVNLPPLLASIRLVSLSESGPLAAAPALPAAVPQKVRQRSPGVESLSARRSLQAAGPANRLVNQPVNQPVNAAAPAVPAASTAAPVAVASPVPAETLAVAPRPQAELLAAYRQRLRELFAQHQEYPRVAALRGWEGEVRLRLKVARKGNLLTVQLDQSSGFEVLDQHAVAMLEALAALPPLPDALDSNEIQVVVPINYKLKKTT